MRSKSDGPLFLWSQWVPFLVILVTVAILGGTVFLACRQLRLAIRDQISRRDSQILYALWLSQQADQIENGAPSEADQFWALLETSHLRQLKGFEAARLYDAEAQFITAYPPVAREGVLSPDDMAELRKFRPVSHFYANYPKNELWLLPSNDEPQNGPLLEVIIPVHYPGAQKLAGIAQFYLNGDNIAAEFAALDKHLLKQGSMAFLVSGAIVVLFLGLAFRQLQQTNRLLGHRTQSLLQANQELTLAAKTAAIGAVTSHLIHGLKNPLSGLHNFITSRESAADGQNDDDWQLAAKTTRRMQGLVNEVVRVLREERSTSQYDLSFEDLGEMIRGKMGVLAKQAGIDFQADVKANGILSNRNANLVLLILENLIQNGIQATSRGKQVFLAIVAQGDKVICEVRDQGSGLPQQCEKTLFKPCVSTKEGGSGIGLSISKQLANYLGADLELTRNSDEGCSFALILPAALTSGSVSSETDPASARTMA